MANDPKVLSVHPSQESNALWSFAVICVLFGVAKPASAEQIPQLPSLSQDQVERLEAGEVLVDVVNQEVPVGDIIGIIDAPPEAVAAVITDFDNYEDFMPSMDESELLEHDGNHYVCRGVTDTPWPMDDREWTVDVIAGMVEIDGAEYWVSSWDYVPGSGNLVDTEGYWLLIPWGDGSRTLVRYYLVADLGTWLPDFLLEWGTEEMLPGMIEAIRDRV